MLNYQRIVVVIGDDWSYEQTWLTMGTKLVVNTTIVGKEINSSPKIWSDPTDDEPVDSVWGESLLVVSDIQKA